MVVGPLDTQPASPVAAQYWSSIYDVVCLRQSEGEWVCEPQVGRLRGREFLALIHHVFTDKHGPFFKSVTTTCSPMTHGMRIYSVYACSSSFWQIYQR